MTVADLIEMLQNEDSTAKVQLGYQPNYPLASHIDSVTTIRDSLDRSGQSDYEDQLDIVYILEGTQIGYLPSGLWD